MRPVMAPVLDVATPWLDEVTVKAVEVQLQIEGRLRLGVTRLEGGLVEGPPVQWTWSAKEHLMLLVVAMAAWALPSVGWRRRAAALPVTLFLVALITAADVTVELQHTTLRTLSEGALGHISLANTEENRAALLSFERQFRGVLWVKAFSDAGGRLFLAVLAGLSVAAVPSKGPRAGAGNALPITSKDDP